MFKKIILVVLMVLCVTSCVFAQESTVQSKTDQDESDLLTSPSINIIDLWVANVPGGVSTYMGYIHIDGENGRMLNMVVYTAPGKWQELSAGVGQVLVANQNTTVIGAINIGIDPFDQKWVQPNIYASFNKGPILGSIYSMYYIPMDRYSQEIFFADPMDLYVRITPAGKEKFVLIGLSGGFTACQGIKPLYKLGPAVKFGDTNGSLEFRLSAVKQKGTPDRLEFGVRKCIKF